MKTICGTDCAACAWKERCKGCAQTGGSPFGGGCVVAACYKAGGEGRLCRRKEADFGGIQCARHRRSAHGYGSLPAGRRICQFGISLARRGNGKAARRFQNIPRLAGGAPRKRQVLRAGRQSDVPACVRIRLQRRAAGNHPVQKAVGCVFQKRTVQSIKRGGATPRPLWLSVQKLFEKPFAKPVIIAPRPAPWCRARSSAPRWCRRSAPSRGCPRR